MKANHLILAAASVLFLGGCTGDYYVSSGYVGGAYTTPYYGGLGPYYSGYGPFYGTDFVVGGVRYRNDYGYHHFYGDRFRDRHFASRGGRSYGSRVGYRGGAGYRGGSWRGYRR